MTDSLNKNENLSTASPCDGQLFRKKNQPYNGRLYWQKFLMKSSRNNDGRTLKHQNLYDFFLTAFLKKPSFTSGTNKAHKKRCKFWKM